VTLNVLELFFLPPLGIARLGGSDTPLESFRWVSDPAFYSGHRTTIEPAVTIVVDDTGIPVPHLPHAIRFRDGEKLRPVAPFFELWMRFQSPGRPVEETAVTLDILRQLGVTTADLRFRITVANKKAQRRTQSASCGFVARVDVPGGDHAPKPLLAYSPTDPDHVPLVRKDAPVPLGSFQVVRPISASGLGVDLSVVRVRFTPAKGEVYGPPSAIAAAASPLPEGENLAWDKVMQGRVHEIVKPENRILNGDSAWTKYVGMAPGQTDPQPYDSYDGAKCGDQRSWGVVDDTCDGVIEGHLVVGSTRFSAYARVAACAPDYAPDCRPFVSISDDLADRDLPELTVDELNRDVTEEEIADLFNRVFETASQINLDAERYKFVGRQERSSRPPMTDLESMTVHDAPYARQAATLINQEYAVSGAAVPRSALQYSDLASTVHAPLTDVYTMLDFLRTYSSRVKLLVRPPFGRVNQLAPGPAPQPNEDFRDPRIDRDTLHDMRMPPYMRDSDDNPLSLTWRQYHTLIHLLDLLAGSPSEPQPDGSVPSTTERSSHSSPRRIDMRVADVLTKLRAARERNAP
jgi:hypothetical protein